MHPEAFQIKSRVCVSDFNLLALQTQLLSKITVQKPYILFQLAFKKKKVLMKVADILKLVQLMPQVSKLAHDIIWPSPKIQSKEETPLA